MENDKNNIMDTVYSGRDDTYIPLCMFRSCDPAMKKPRNHIEKAYYTAREQTDPDKLPSKGYLHNSKA